MAARKWTEANRAVIVANVRATGEISAAAREAGVAEGTVQGWLDRGRKENAGPYFKFALEVRQARAEFHRSSLDREEFDRHLSRAIRNGSVQAMKLWWEINRKDGDAENEKPADPFENLDELAPRRSKRSQTAQAEHG